jgi:cytochrome c-type biogenesis protein
MGVRPAARLPHPHRLLALLGLAGLAGRGPHLRLHLPTIRPRTSGGTAGPGHWALFGVGYAAASLACTIAVLLAVITQAQANTTIAGQLAVFAAYAAGSIALLLVLSAAATLAGSALSRWARALARHQARITAVLLLLTGGYVAAYWWPPSPAAPPPATARPRSTGGPQPPRPCCKPTPAPSPPPRWR